MTATGEANPTQAVHFQPAADRGTKEGWLLGYEDVRELEHQHEHEQEHQHEMDRKTAVTSCFWLVTGF